MLAECLPCCCYPTEVVFLDDSQSYLQMLELFFQQSNLPVSPKLFSNAHEALDYINASDKMVHRQALFAHLLKHVDTFQINNYALTVNVFDLHRVAYNPNRLSQISVIVSDYDLGDQGTGIDFCKAIVDKNIQKILLTGQSEHDFVIKAFNEGFIQRFVHKQEINDFDDIVQILTKAQRAYFQQITKTIIEAVGSRPHFPLAVYCLQFQTFFENLLKNYDIVEYYLLDPVGSYLLLDKAGVSRILFVQNQDQHQANLLDLKDEIGQSISQEMEAPLRRGEYIVCNPTYLDGVKRTLDVVHSIFPAVTIRDDTEDVSFYCALANDNWLLDIQKYKIPQLLRQ
ncbi:MAG: hypothetical protein LBE99_02945 [Puniceicoccales bacterium]|jgi:hypothetical protein|nr:hypothetical protein [Puniceicoccales bacterium]